MKKSLLALAALTAFAGVASAQSSVTLFGIVDLNVRNTKTGPNTVKSLSQDGIASSRLGFRGVEDLGGGLRAGFWLEGAINPDTGTPGGQSWQRRSTVSLMGGFGELRLGRDYTPSFWNYTVFDPFGTNGVAAMSQAVGQLGSGATTFVRANNSVGYFLPAAGGLYGQVQVAAGENVTGNKYTGGRIGYAGGPVNVAVAIGKTDRTGAMIDDYSDSNIGGSVKFGSFTLMGQYSKRDYSTLDEKTILLGGVLAIGAGNLKLAYTKTDGATSALDIKVLGIGYDYNLSKRTALYGTYGKVDRVPANTDTTAYEFGIRHAF
ncbi:MAG: porin [Burkholderiales bacterium]|nr:porin [Burkholderiales bacterium]